MAMKLRRKEPSRVQFETLTKENATQKREQVMETLDLNNTTLSQLFERSKLIEDECFDYTVVEATDKNVMFNDMAGLSYTVTDTGEVRHSPMSRWALSQLGTKIGVPSRYLEKCIASGRIDLAKDNVNSWLADYNKDLFIREYRGSIRGILSNRYSVCDSSEILSAVDGAVDLSKYKIKGSYLSPERLHVRLIGKEMLPVEGEDLFPGIFIDSSDVGRNVLVVQFGIWKQVCTNGLCISKAGGVLFSQKHIGITPEEFYEGLNASLKNIDPLTENAVQWVEFAKDKRVKGLSKSNTSDEIEEFINRLKLSAKLPEDKATKVFDLMSAKYDHSQWGLINALTEVAQDFTLDKRIEIENYAGNLLVA